MLPQQIEKHTNPLLINLKIKIKKLPTKVEYKRRFFLGKSIRED